MNESFVKGNSYVGGSRYYVVIATSDKGMKRDGAATGEEVAFSSFSSSFDKDIKGRWNKAYIWEVLFSGETYNIQTHLKIEVFFLVKVHPLGENLCLSEEIEEGVIQELISNASSWWKTWFRLIRPWQ